MATQSLATPASPRGNHLGKILADAATLTDSDMGVLLTLLRGMRNGIEFDDESLRSASDEGLRALAHGRHSQGVQS